MEHKTWTAAELGALSPEERQRVYEESLVRDIAELPLSEQAHILTWAGPAVERSRAFVEERIRQEEAQAAD